MIVALYGKRIHLWLLSLSKTRAGIMYFLMTAIPVIVIYLLAGLVFYHSFWAAFKHNNFFLIIIALDAIFGAIFFRERALEDQRKKREFTSRELTPEDEDNLEFVTYWKKKRQSGALKYILTNSLFTGCILFLPVSLLLYPYNGPTINPFTELSNMLGFILKCFCIGIFAGAAFNVITWQLNQRRFSRLTQTIDKNL